MESLFKIKNGDWRLNACINWLNGDVDDKWGRYADGYKEAADNLVEQVKNERFKADTFVYPIVFNYRQYVELRLKELIIKGRKLYDIPDQLKKNHNLSDLWKECRGLLERVWPKGAKQDLDKVERLIMDFHVADPSSYSFRYPVNTKGEETIPDKVHINLGNLSEKMAIIADLLDGASCGIYEYLEHKNWEKSELRREIGNYR